MSSDFVSLSSPPDAPFRFEAEVSGASAAAPGRRVRISGPGVNGTQEVFEHTLPTTDQNAWLDLFHACAGVFGTRIPHGRTPFEPPPHDGRLQPVLTEAASADILYGYGDPSVLRVENGPDAGWWLTATSNDAPNAFPILHSTDCRTWTPRGFVFPEGAAPGWTLTGLKRGDFWAPELHRVGDQYWLCFSARQETRELAIGIARADRPQGPWRAPEVPLLGGGVIDAHLLARPGEDPILFWKEDTNGVWPRLLAARLNRTPALIETLFPRGQDRGTAALAATLWPWVSTLAPMEQFFILQPLIEAASDDFDGFEARLKPLCAEEPDLEPMLQALKTRVFAQRLSADGTQLVGERVVALENDRPWEAHLIEGVWVSEQDGRFHLFYAGNDFSTARYGIGTAIADDPFGPYRKQPEALLGTTAEWWGPGHPSVAPGPDGTPWLFLHAFRPCELGYKAFRAVLGAPLDFSGEHAAVR